MQSRTTTTAGKQQLTLNDNLVSQILCQIETALLSKLLQNWSIYFLGFWEKWKWKVKSQDHFFYIFYLLMMKLA